MAATSWSNAESLLNTSRLSPRGSRTPTAASITMANERARGIRPVQGRSQPSGDSDETDEAGGVDGTHEGDDGDEGASDNSTNSCILSATEVDAFPSKESNLACQASVSAPLKHQ